MTSPTPAQPAAPAWLSPAMDYGPLAVFFATYMLVNLMAATAAMLVATAIAIAVSLILTRRVPTSTLLVAAFVGIFGGMTLIFNDETFVKVRGTIVQFIFAGILLGGLAFKRSLLKPLMKKAWPMDEAGWRILTFRVALLFATLATLNELVRRFGSTDLWVTYDVFGSTTVTILFLVAQWPLLNRHMLPDDAQKKPD